MDRQTALNSVLSEASGLLPQNKLFFAGFWKYLIELAACRGKKRTRNAKDAKMKRLMQLLPALVAFVKLYRGKK